MNPVETIEESVSTFTWWCFASSPVLTPFFKIAPWGHAAPAPRTPFVGEKSGGILFRQTYVTNPVYTTIQKLRNWRSYSCKFFDLAYTIASKENTQIWRCLFSSSNACTLHLRQLLQWHSLEANCEFCLRTLFNWYMNYPVVFKGAFKNRVEERVTTVSET